MDEAPDANRGPRLRRSATTKTKKGGSHGVTKRKARLPYVGDPPTFLGESLPLQDNKIKTDHACSVCGTPFAPFGAGYPNATVWFCFQHSGEVMPEVQENMVKVKLDFVRRKCPYGASLWLDLMIAADDNDLERCRRLWPQIRDVSVAVSDLLKSLNTEKTNG